MRRKMSRYETATYRDQFGTYTEFRYSLRKKKRRRGPLTSKWVTKEGEVDEKNSKFGGGRLREEVRE